MENRNTFRWLILIILAVGNSAYAQYMDQPPLEKYKINTATMNGRNISPTLLAANAHTIFYKNRGSRKRWMANVWGNARSQSYGRMYSIKKIRTNNPNTKVLRFKWEYVNTYDEKKGIALVEVEKTTKSGKILLSMKMTLENSDLIVYSGTKE